MRSTFKYESKHCPKKCPKATAWAENHYNHAPAVVPNSLYPHAKELHVLLSSIPETSTHTVLVFLVSGLLSLSTPPSRMPTPDILAIKNPAQAQMPAPAHTKMDGLSLSRMLTIGMPSIRLPHT